MMSPLTSAFLYLVLGIIFTIFAIQHVLINGWGFIAYALILIATLDFGSGLHLLFWYIKQKIE